MKWEYKKVTIRLASFIEELNKLGKEGWELVSADTDGQFGLGFLKRPLVEVLQSQAIDTNEVVICKYKGPPFDIGIQSHIEPHVRNHACGLYDCVPLSEHVKKEGAVCEETKE